MAAVTQEMAARAKRNEPYRGVDKRFLERKPKNLERRALAREK